MFMLMGAVTSKVAKKCTYLDANATSAHTFLYKLNAENIFYSYIVNIKI